MTDPTEKPKKGGLEGGKKKKSHDFHMNSFDCTAHSQLYAGKNIGGSPELHLTDSSRPLWGRVKCHRKSSTQVTHRRVRDNASSSAQGDAHETHPLLGAVTLGGLRAVIHAIIELSSAFQVTKEQNGMTPQPQTKTHTDKQEQENEKLSATLWHSVFRVIT